MNVREWQLRDSNWLPDFPSDAEMAIDAYRREHGKLADQLDGVIAITPTVAEELLKITGPLTVGGQTFAADTFTEKLEYAVEHGYAEQGLAFKDRKQVLGDAVRALLTKLMETGYKHYDEYMALVPRLFEQKQVMVYSAHSDEQAAIAAHDWDGAIASVSGDYLLWADANLAAFKTDAVVSRTVKYSIVTTTKGLVATAAETITNNGAFTWRTTRYRDYARVFVPAGSTFISASGTMLADKNTKPGSVDQGQALDRQWFGAYVSVEPGQTRTISFTYLLPQSVSDSVANGKYQLSVQKELGLVDPGLTLHLSFGKKIAGAHPGEAADKLGDDIYDVTSTLLVDRVFSVSF